MGVGREPSRKNGKTEKIDCEVAMPRKLKPTTPRAETTISTINILIYLILKTVLIEKRCSAWHKNTNILLFF
jgi:hypothetical protein